MRCPTIAFRALPSLWKVQRSKPCQPPMIRRRRSIQEQLLELVMNGEFLFFAAFFFKPEQKPFAGQIVVFDLQSHDGADPGKGIGQGTKESAIAEASVREDIDRVKQRLEVSQPLQRKLPDNYRTKLSQGECSQL